MAEGDQTLPGTEGQKQKQRRVVLAVFELYESWPTWKQIIVLLLFMSLSAICFQLIHGFDVLCKYSTKTGLPICIATEERDTTGWGARRAATVKQNTDVIRSLGGEMVEHLDARLDSIEHKLDTVVIHTQRLETVVEILAANTGNTGKILKQLEPKVKPRGLFGEIGMIGAQP